MNVKVVILAAGQGKRFGSPLPKVLAPVGGKPMGAWVVDAVLKSGVTDRPVVVVGAGADAVRAALGEGCDYVIQAERRGTGHAVAQCRTLLEGHADAILVLHGDMPMLTAATIRRMVDAHLADNATLTMATATVEDFADWRRALASYGRVIRNAAGELERIVEASDATPTQRQILELNPSFFCFDADWLWRNIGSLRSANVQGELYLTDLLGLAVAEGMPVHTVPVEPREALGANTPEELTLLAQLAA